MVSKVKSIAAELDPLPRIVMKVRRTLKGHLVKIYATHWASDKRHLISASQDGNLIKSAVRGMDLLPRIVETVRRTLNGHLAKFYAMHRASDKRHLVSASQNGNLIVSNSSATDKVFMTSHRSSRLERDNVCSIYNQKTKEGSLKVARELSQHTGYLSCCNFIYNQPYMNGSQPVVAIARHSSQHIMPPCNRSQDAMAALTIVLKMQQQQMQKQHSNDTRQLLPPRHNPHSRRNLQPCYPDPVRRSQSSSGSATRSRTSSVLVGQDTSSVL